MNLSDKTLAVYYHMPFVIKEDCILSNPVIGTFIESLVPYFAKVMVFGFECVINQDRISYRLPYNAKIQFISLGPEGRFWDHVQNRIRIKKTVRKYKSKIDILLLRLPSFKAYSVWKHLGKPPLTSLLFVGNPLLNPNTVVKNSFDYMFRRYRSKLFNKRMKKLCREAATIVFVNSESLVDVWGEILDKQVILIHTSSISDSDIFICNSIRKFNNTPIKLLFVGRVCFDKGIRELFDALNILNQDNNTKYHLDIVGAEDNLGSNTLKQLAKKYGVQNAISHHGVVPFGEKLFEFYRNADAYILPSYHEGMPHSIWESISQGTPVISTPVGGVGDFFNDGENILFLKVRDSKSIVEVVQKLKNDKQLQSTLIKNGFKKVFKITRESQSEKIVTLMKRNWN
ncbi:MAG: glycosyltransferase family 4 protein [Bacteroidetes bacterium]|nr:glycosyltransferase family 4 protein [Bacteroidota bacterium]